MFLIKKKNCDFKEKAYNEKRKKQHLLKLYHLELYVLKSWAVKRALYLCLQLSVLLVHHVIY